MKTNVLTLVITLVVGIILTGSLLVPTINDSKTTHTATQTDGSFVHYATTEFGHEYTFEDGSIHYDGTDLEITSGDILSDKFKVIVYNGAVRLYDVTEPNRTYVATSLTISSDGSYSFTTTDDTIEGADKLEWFAGPANTGDYVAVVTSSETSEVKLNADSKIYMCTNAAMKNEANVSLDTAYRLQNVSGTIYNLNADGFIYSTNTWVESLGKVAVSSTANKDGTITYSTANSNTWSLDGYTVETADVYLYVPLEFKVYDEGPNNALLSAIPLLVIISLVVAVVSVVIKSKD